MNKLILIVLAPSILLLSCTSSKIQEQVNEINTISKEEYEVYSIVLNYAEIENVNTWNTPKPLFIIYKQTGLPDRIKLTSENDGKRLLERIGRNSNIKLDISLIDDFKKKNENTHNLENKFSLPKDIVLIYNPEQEKLNRFIEISRVEFNNYHTQALLYYGRQIPLAGNGVIILLIKENDKWTIRYMFDIWVS